jgi:type IV pilus assembly protein PilE
MKTYKNKRSGFTIIELMIVIGIVALLVALAYPSYAQYVLKARRGEAQQLLLNWSINQEIWRSNNTEYATLAQLPEPEHENYDFSLPARSPTEYTLQADAQGGQTEDKARGGTFCTTLTLNQSGVKTEAVCWN